MTKQKFNITPAPNNTVYVWYAAKSGAIMIVRFDGRKVRAKDETARLIVSLDKETARTDIDTKHAKTAADASTVTVKTANTPWDHLPIATPAAIIAAGAKDEADDNTTATDETAPATLTPAEQLHKTLETIRNNPAMSAHIRLDSLVESGDASAREIKEATETARNRARDLALQTFNEAIREYGFLHLTDDDGNSRKGYQRSYISYRLTGYGEIARIDLPFATCNIMPAFGVARAAGYEMMEYKVVEKDGLRKPVITVNREACDYMVSNFGSLFMAPSKKDEKDNTVYYATQTVKDSRTGKTHTIVHKAKAGGHGAPYAKVLNYRKYFAMFKEDVTARINMALDRKGYRIARNLTSDIRIVVDHAEK